MRAKYSLVCRSYRFVCFVSQCAVNRRGVNSRLTIIPIKTIASNASSVQNFPYFCGTDDGRAWVRVGVHMIAF